MDFVSLLLFLVFLANAAIGVFVTKRAIPREVDFLFIAGQVGLALWVLAEIPMRATGNPVLALYWYRLVLSSSTLIPLSLVGYSLLVPVGRSRHVGQDFLLIYMPNILVNIAIWLPGCVVSVLPRHGFEPMVTLGPLYLGYVAYVFLTLNWVVLRLLWKMGEDEPFLLREQMRWRMIGIVVPGTIGFITNVLLPIFHIVTFSYIGQLLTPIYSMSILYAMVRYRFQDLDQYLKQGAIYFLLSGLITASYLLSVQFLQKRVMDFLAIRWDVFSALLLILFAFAFQPLRDLLQRWTENMIGRQITNFRRTLRQTSVVLARAQELDQLVRIAGRVMYGGLPIAGLTIAVWDKTQKNFHAIAAFGNARGSQGIRFSHEMHFVQTFRKESEPLSRLAVEEAYYSARRSAEKNQHSLLLKELIELKGRIVLGAFGRGVRGEEHELLAVIIFGEKRSGEPYRSEEVHILTSIANQMGAAIENAFLYEDLKEKYSELRVAQDKLFQAEKLAALGTMAAGIAHEIKNPLAAMKLFTDLPLQTLERQEYRDKFLQVVIPEIERLDRFVNELLEYSRPTQPRFEQVSLSELVEKALRLLEIRFKRHQISVRRSFDTVPPVTVDPSKMMQVLMNIFGNAIQAMPGGGAITTRIRPHDHRVRLEIEDTGVGIPPDKLKTIFTPFYTTHKTGTGLGLAITQRIIEEHRGTIGVESEMGQGATVTIEFPLKPIHQLELVSNKWKES